MNRRLLSAVLIVSSLVLLTGGISLLFGDDQSSSGDVAAVEETLRSPTTTPPPEAPAEATTPAPTTTTAPPASETAPPVDIADPVGLRIERLDIDAPVAAYGVDQRTGQMEVPDNVIDVGWYRFGPRPGEPGSSVLAAHVDLAGSGPGVFYDLGSLEEGDRVVVVHADGTEAAFRVLARTTYEKDELPLDIIFSREGPPVLTLITCGGAFNRDISRYDSNVVVYAVPDLGNQPRGRSSTL